MAKVFAITGTDGRRYEFFPATMDGVPVIGLHYDFGPGTEGTEEWSAEVPSVPQTEEEAVEYLGAFRWVIVNSTDNFQEQKEDQ